MSSHGDDRPSLPDIALQKVVAEAIYEGLQRRNPDAGVFPEPAPHQRTTIDGNFYLYAVARHVLRAIEDYEATLKASK